jgi:transposase, IS5 family
MRAGYQNQPSLRFGWLAAEPARELARISELLDGLETLEGLVSADLRSLSRRQGSQGGRREVLGAQQVLRALILKQLHGFTYRELVFHLADSQTYRTFCRLGMIDPAPSKSVLAAAIKALRPATLEALHRAILGIAQRARIESGKKARIDCTVVASAIREPTDSSLLGDGVRIVLRALHRACEQEVAIPGGFADRSRRAKRRVREIFHAKNSAQRQAGYRDLLVVAEEVLGWGCALEKRLRRKRHRSPALKRVARSLDQALPLLRRVIDQARRRVFGGESVPAAEKVTSFFETHTDIVRKDARNTYYGHKLCLVTGASSLILDAVVLDGNPADSTLPETMITRQIEIFGRPPRQAAFDGGFTSRANLDALKAQGVEDVAFSKRRNLPVADMTRSLWVYRRLRRFRAGIEANISLLKRAFGLDRCNWRSRDSFHSYVWSSLLACNLLGLARLLLAR